MSRRSIYQPSTPQRDVDTARVHHLMSTMIVTFVGVCVGAVFPPVLIAVAVFVCWRVYFWFEVKRRIRRYHGEA